MQSHLTRFLILYTLSCVVSLAADLPKRVKVAIIAPLSGPSDYFGPVIANGIKLGLKDANIEILQYDDSSDREKAKALVNQAATEGCVSIFGPMETHTAAAAIPEASRRGIPIISPSATGDYLSKLDPAKWFFRANSSDKARARDVAEWIIQEHARKAALVVYEIGAGIEKRYGTAIGEAVIERLAESQMPTVTRTFERGAIDSTSFFTSIKDALKSTEISAVGIFGLSTDTKRICEKVRLLRPDVQIYLVSCGLNMFGKPPVDQNIFSVCDNYLESLPSPELKTFRVLYQATYPDHPDPLDQYATFGFDGARLLLAALQSLGPDAHLLGVEELRIAITEALRRTPNDRLGLMSTGGFTVDQELTFRPHRIKMVEGKWQQLGESPQPDLRQPAEPKPFPVFTWKSGFWWASWFFVGVAAVGGIAFAIKKRKREPKWILSTPEKPNNGIIVFVHGLGGDAHGTWQKFPELLRGDSEVAATFDVGFYGFPTGIVIAPWAKPVAITTLADGLAASLRLRFSSYERIVLVSHSLGGVVVRKLLQRLIMSASAGDHELLQNVVGVGLYGVPNKGASLANIGSFLNFWHRHLKQLCRDSDYLTEMNQWWESAGPQAEIAKIPLLVAMGASDMVVPLRSARLRGASVQEFVIVDPDPNNADHLGIVKPKNRDSMSYLALKRLLVQCAAIKGEARVTSTN